MTKASCSEEERTPMQQEELQQIQKWCQQSEDAILFYAPDGTLLWQNDAAAVRQKPQNSSLPRYHKNGAPEDGMFLLRQGGSLYCVRQEPRQYGKSRQYWCRSTASRQTIFSGAMPTSSMKRKTRSLPCGKRSSAFPTPSAGCIRRWRKTATRSPAWCWKNKWNS